MTRTEAESATMNLRGHLTELRLRLIKASAAVLVGSIVGFVYHEKVLAWLVTPYRASIGRSVDLAFFRPTEAFSVVMKLSLFTGFVLASPIVIYQGWRFVSPALSRSERRSIIPVTGILALLFAMGVGLGYKSLERGLGFLLGFGGEALEPIIQAEAYLGFAMRYILIFGAAFEFPVFLFSAVAVGIVSGEALRANRRWAVTIILVVGAVVTPSGDPLTLLLLAVPLYVLHEITIVVIRIVLKK